MFHKDLQTFFQSFNNREIATGIWLLIVFFICFFLKGIRQALVRVIVTLLDERIIKMNLFFIGYCVLLVYIFRCIGLWDLQLLKTTLFWLFGAEVLLINSFEKTTEPSYFVKLVKHSFTWTILIEIIVNLNSFSLFCELILVPFLFFIGILTAFSKEKTEYDPVHRVLKWILNGIAFVIILYAIVHTIRFARSVFITENLNEILLPPVLTVLFIPFIYIVALYAGYEHLFTMLKLRPKRTKKQLIKIKFALFSTCKFNIKKIKRVNRHIERWNVEDIQKMKRLLAKIK